jgi:hypothetical protein
MSSVLRSTGLLYTCRIPNRAFFVLSALTGFGASVSAHASSSDGYVSARASYQVMRAERSEASARFDEALESLRVAQVYDSDSPYIAWRLARVAVLAAAPKTLRLIRDAIQIAPRHAGVRRLEGLVLWGRGDLQGAQRALRRAARLRAPRGQVKAAIIDLADLLAGRGKLRAAARGLKRLAAGDVARARAESRIAELAGDPAVGIAALHRGTKAIPPRAGLQRRLAAMHALLDAAANAPPKGQPQEVGGLPAPPVGPALEGVDPEVVALLRWTGRLNEAGEEARSRLASAIRARVKKEEP